MTYKNNIIRFALVALFCFFSANKSFSQATTVVTSSNGYKVSVSLTPVSIIAPNSCQYGYNYNTRINYSISFSGSNIPNKLYTLQTNLYCSSQANFVSLPLNGGSGNLNTHSNPYRNTSDCGSATVSSLNCNGFNLIIEGPGIPSQTIYMPYVVALPVKYSNLESKNFDHNTVINWSTSFEVNNKYFAVERSANGETWTEIAQVKAGNQGGIQNYTATDKQPLKGTSYYRIRQVDNNGEVYFSALLTSTRENTIIDFNVFPNPANTQFSIEAANIEDLDIKVMNTQGQTFELNSEINGTLKTFSTEGLENGIYFISIQSNGQSISKSIIVSK